MFGLTTVGVFLVSLIFSFIILTLWLRIALRYFRVSSLNQFSQLIHSITNPMIHPFDVFFKQKHQPGQKYHWMAFIILIVIEFIKIITLSLLIFHNIIPLAYLILYVVSDLIIQPCTILFYAILIRVLMSFINPHWQHPLSDFLRVLTEPLLMFGRKIIPDISGFDFSPFIIMIILKIITLFISASLPGNLL